MLATYDVPTEDCAEHSIQDVLRGEVNSPPVELELIIPSEQGDKASSRIPIPVRTQGTSAYESVKYQGSCYTVKGRQKSTRRVTIKIPVEILDKPAPNCPYKIRPIRQVGYIPPSSRALGAPIVTKGNLRNVPRGSRSAKRAPEMPQARSILKRRQERGMIRPSYGPTSHQLPIYPPPEPYVVEPNRRKSVTGPGRTPPRPTGAIPKARSRGGSLPPQQRAAFRAGQRTASMPPVRRQLLPEIRAPGQMMRANQLKSGQGKCSAIPTSMDTYGGVRRRTQAVVDSAMTPQPAKSASGTVPVRMGGYVPSQAGASGWQGQLRTISGTPRKLPGAAGRATRGPLNNPPTPNIRPVRSTINSNAFKNTNRDSNWQGQIMRPGYLSNRKLPGAMGRIARSQKQEQCRPTNWN